jgi:hypothetical protein
VGDLIFTGPEFGNIVSGVFTPPIDILGHPFWGTHKKMTGNYE